MTFNAKPTKRPLALEGWFEKPTNRLSNIEYNTFEIIKE
jgi:hypothetical protein